MPKEEEEMKIAKSRLKQIIKEEISKLLEATRELVCPEPTQDLELNTKNRNSAIKADHIKYGPLNLTDESYWKSAAKHWDTSPEVAKESRCYNCVAFDISPRMQDCMPGVLMTQDEIEDAINKDEPWETLGYCWMHNFKCHSARTCYTWAKGKNNLPITDNETSYDWQERNKS